MINMCDKLDLLREMESFIYQVAYYLLNDEKPAVEASKQTIKEIMDDEKFFQMDQTSRKKFIRNVTIHKSFHVYFENGTR